MKSTTFCYLAGGLSLLGGILALANPFAASLTATVLAGWSFIAVGALMLVAANHPPGFNLAVFLLGLLVLALGVHLVFDPLRGMVPLTAAVGALLLLAALLRITAALRLYGYFRGTLLVSGLLSFILAVLIFADFPQSANVILGLFLAIELLSNGVSLVALGMAQRRH
ncbi:MAG: DUF308 domain-containing protein [Cardiobacterium sp.]|jgi:hypothetical protein